MRWAREPLVHFLLAGAALFAVDAAMRAGRGGTAGDRPADDVVHVSRADAERLARDFTAASGRAPTEAEARDLIAAFVRQEILFREGLQRGLHRADDEVRRRVAAGMDYLAEDRDPIPEPDDAALAAFLQAHADRYRAPGRTTFTQLFFHAEAAARAALTALQAGGSPDGVGDATRLPHQYRRGAASELRLLFGPGFAEALARAPAGQWSGPLQSHSGWHLVRVTAREPGTLPAAADIRERLAEDYVEARHQAARDAQYDAVRQRYRVDLEPGVPAPASR